MFCPRIIVPLHFETKIYLINMYRTNTCGELRLANAGQQVKLAGWVQRTRKMGGMTFVDLRDRYGLTQLVFDESKDAELCEQANRLGREWCIQVVGTVSERQSKNSKMETGDIEILVEQLNVLSESQIATVNIDEVELPAAVVQLHLC